MQEDDALGSWSVAAWRWSRSRRWLLRRKAASAAVVFRRGVASAAAVFGGGDLRGWAVTEESADR